MSAHAQLVAHQAADPRAALLCRLYEEQSTLLRTLIHINALHAVQHQAGHGLRTNWAGADDGKLYAHPEDVRMLLFDLFDALDRLWEEAITIDDELYVAAFAMYGITAIHPFMAANGRTAMDFGQYLLMHRWGSKEPPIGFGDGAHHMIGGLFQGLDQLAEDNNPLEFVLVRQQLILRFRRTDLSHLKSMPAFQVAVAWFQTGVRIPWSEG
ncbi:MAG: Fic family protein [Deltaproteobacteria bacterium]|nr:Fic family protein [Deltaproteobacteria bacterium]